MFESTRVFVDKTHHLLELVNAVRKLYVCGTSLFPMQCARCLYSVSFQSPPLPLLKLMVTVLHALLELDWC